MGEGLIINHLTLGTKLLNNVINLEGVPIKHSIGDQAQAARLIHDLLVLTLPDHSQLRELESEYQEAKGDLEIAIAKLEEAQQQRTLKLDTPAQRAELLGKMREVEEKLNTVGIVRSPYSGRIKSIKWLEQTNQQLQVELIVMTEI